MVIHFFHTSNKTLPHFGAQLIYTCQSYQGLSWDTKTLCPHACAVFSDQKWTSSLYPSIVNCDQSLKREYAGEALRRKSKLPSENIDFDKAFGWGIPPSGRSSQKDLVVLVKVTAGIQSSLYLPFLILALRISQQVNSGCGVNRQISCPLILLSNHTYILLSRLFPY